jgi:iron complex outermembrane recepter protein
VPQGLSVFVDGVRVNELLGDVVNWDLLPEPAIDAIVVVPGSNPLYGRNTLGGALSVETRRGFTDPGSAVEASGGSFGRWRTTARTGGSRGRFDYLAAASITRDGGFRDFSDSEQNQLFGEVGWRDDDTDLRLTYTAAHDEIRGNGPAPESLLAADRSAVYTQPDLFRPDLHFVSLVGRRRLRLDVDVDAGFYVRDLSTRQSNADAAEADDRVDDAMVPGVLRSAETDQTRYGGHVAASVRRRVLQGENQATAGVEVEHGDADFALRESDGVLDDRRTVVALGPSRPRTDVGTDADALGAYAVDTYTPAAWISLTPSVRYDRVRLSIDDRLGGAAGGVSEFHRVDPGAGVTLRPAARLGLFASYVESFRAPTAIELTCASESAPCPLPIAFVEDPPLRKVRARTFEAGVRTEPLTAAHARVAAYRTDLEDDILFVSSARSVGFFQNAGRTRRKGVEALLDGRFARVSWFANYTFTLATFESAETLRSPLGDQPVRPGDRLPGVPDHLVRFGVDADLPASFLAGVEVAYTGRQFLRGDEANRARPLSPYTVVGARLEWRRGPLTVFARAENLLDAEYESAGSFAANAFADDRVERFLSPGAPLGGWFGVRVEL